MWFNKKKSIRHLNRIASQYNRYAVVQKRMAYQLIQHLMAHASTPKVIVEWGCGTGYFTQLLLDLLKPDRLIAIDIAEKMIEHAKNHITSSKVEWIIGDIENQVWIESLVDLIVSNSVLHWVVQPNALIQQSWQRLRLGGQFVHTVMGPDTFQELRTLFRQVEWELGLNLTNQHKFLRSAEEWKEIYTQAGFSDVEIVENWQRVEFTDCRDFFETIQGMGAIDLSSKQGLLTTYQVLSRVMQKYNYAYRTKKGVYATFHTILCSAKKLDRSS